MKTEAEKKGLHTVEELVATLKRARHELCLAKPKNDKNQDQADIDGAVNLIDCVIAKSS